MRRSDGSVGLTLDIISFYGSLNHSVGRPQLQDILVSVTCLLK